MSFWTWLSKIGHTVKVKIAPIVVGALELVQDAENSGLLPGLAKLIDNATHGKVATEINTALQAEVPKLIAVWLGVETISADSTVEQQQAFSQAVTAAFLSKKAQQSVPGQVAQELGVQVFNIIKNVVTTAHAHETAVTAAQISEAVEEAFQDLQEDIANAKAAADSAE